jgi:hypothetical protein
MRMLLCGLALALVPMVALGGETTKVGLYAPFGFDGLRSDFQVSSKIHGSCWTGSIASSRSDVRRCTVTNRVYDPCFSNGRLSSVACPIGAFSKSVIPIILDKPLPVHYGNHGTPSPWALLLSNGARCYMVTGATGGIAGMRLNYVCNTKGWVLGEVDRSTKPCQVFYSANPDVSDYTQVGIREVIL